MGKLKPNFHIVSWKRVLKKDLNKIDYIRVLSKRKLSINAKEILNGMLKSRPQMRWDINKCLKNKWFNNNNNISIQNHNDNID